MRGKWKRRMKWVRLFAYVNWQDTWTLGVRCLQWLFEGVVSSLKLRLWEEVSRKFGLSYDD